MEAVPDSLVGISISGYRIFLWYVKIDDVTLAMLVPMRDLCREYFRFVNRRNMYSAEACAVGENI